MTNVSDMAPALCGLRELIWLRCSGAGAGGAFAAPAGGQRRLLLVARPGTDKLHTQPPAALLLLAACAIRAAGLAVCAAATIVIAGVYLPIVMQAA